MTSAEEFGLVPLLKHLAFFFFKIFLFQSLGISEEKNSVKRLALLPASKKKTITQEL